MAIRAGAGVHERFAVIGRKETNLHRRGDRKCHLSYTERLSLLLLQKSRIVLAMIDWAGLVPHTSSVLPSDCYLARKNLGRSRLNTNPNAVVARRERMVTCSYSYSYSHSKQNRV